jgi:alpha-beta hydrolase superfamily lysophospholipase
VEVEEAEGGRRDDIIVITTDGVQLQCRRSSHPDGARAVAVVVHGFASGRDHPDIRALADQLFSAQLDVVTYDARGHGLSEGHCGVGSTEHLDVACVVSQVTTGDMPVVVIGVSMGAVAVVSHLARIDTRDEAVIGAVLVSAPSRWRMRPSAVGLLMALVTRSGVGRWVSSRWLGVRIKRGWWPGEAPESAIARIAVPVVVVHGDADRLLTSSHARRLHTSGRAANRLHIVQGMGHGLDALGQGAVFEAVQWLLSDRDTAVPSEIPSSEGPTPPAPRGIEDRPVESTAAFTSG